MNTQSPSGALALFAGGLALTSISSFVLSRSIEEAGGRLKLSGGLLGVCVALGANAPETSSAIAALVTGNSELGLGVILGSNIFNIASLLGLSAIVSGHVSVTRRAAAIHGGTSFFSSAFVLALLAKILSAAWTLTCLVLILVPYFVIVARGPKSIAEFKTDTVTEKSTHHLSSPWTSALTAIPALASVVLGSIWMVKAVEVLGSSWHLPHVVIGTLVLATVTGIPNAVAAVSLARRGRGPAVLTEAFNSNNLNILVGICLPSAILGITRSNNTLLFEISFLLGMTALSTLLLAFGKGLSRYGGGILLAAYAVFVLMILFWI